MGEQQKRAMTSYLNSINPGVVPAATGGGAPNPQFPSPAGGAAAAGPPNPFAPFQFGNQLPSAPTPPTGFTNPAQGFPAFGNAQAGFGNWQCQAGAYQMPSPMGQPGPMPGQAPGYPYGMTPMGFGPHAPHALPGLYEGPASRAAQTAGPRRTVSGEVMGGRMEESYYHRHYEREREIGPRSPIPFTSLPTGPPPSPPTLPPMPFGGYHTCIECGNVRSTAYHRAHPVIPGQPVIQSFCRRCKRKKHDQEDEESLHQFTRIRKCIADKPCDWPERGSPPDDYAPYEERRGRLRSRSHSSGGTEVIFRRRGDRSSRRYITRSESRTRMGVRMLQQPDSPPRIMRKRSKSAIRVARPDPPGLVRSLSQSPPPRRRREFQHRSYSPTHEEMHMSSRSRIRRTSYSPPPEQVEEVRFRRRTHSVSPPQPPPPPMGFRARSPSPERRGFRPGSRDDAERRLAVHPRPFRQVYPGSPRGIMKSPDRNQENRHRRWQNVHRSQESVMVEVGGARVQFAPDRAPHFDEASKASSEREEFTNNTRRWDYTQRHSVDDGYKPHRREQDIEYRYRHQRSLSPPTAQMESMHMRHVSPPRGRAMRRTSTPHPHPPPMHEHPASVYKPMAPEPRHPDLTPSPPRARRLKESEWEEITASGSEVSADVVRVRTYKDVDENGKPITVIEERRTFSVPESRREREREPEMSRMPGEWRDC
ncbi:hypothetical protein EJ04DRAFT_580886 [Polyplosphaeria fusca]|uniref:Uncharacterized protein n=1 Tax=Polyplosphaeria fusca TaxID=682080 RepID=A0A9P4QMI0_9PLEO|nr:hypothetical protein EJ04DRAFT_580886 [Polyplosphaeria fusca]